MVWKMRKVCGNIPQKVGECIPLCNNHNLIIHSECPERNDIAETGFYIIFYDISLFCLGYLLLTFLLATYLKGLAGYQKIRDGRIVNGMVHSHLIKEKGLTLISYIGSF